MTDVLDFGVIDEPLLVFGGPYGNLQATRALLAEARRLGIPNHRLLCTGDLVAYCANPAETVALIREAAIAVVMGNCEEQLGAGAEDCGCGYAADSACDLLAVQWYRHATEALDQETKAWMAALPRRAAMTIGDRRLVAVHGGVEQINRFVFPATPAAEKAAEIAIAGTDGVIAGHSGLPFTQVVEGRLWHNAGVIGLPANDGTPRVWYAVIRPGADGISVEHHPLAYDHDAASRAIRDHGLPAAYADTLQTGLWPNDDIMPDEDGQRRGMSLDPHAVSWHWRADTVAEEGRLTG